MDTLRVDICYRPLRVGWAIRAGDFDAFRQAVRFTHTLWGGRFNPILIADNEEESGRLIDLFHVDVIYPLGNSEIVQEFPERFPHLITPWIPKDLFIGGGDYPVKCQLLDIHNALVHIRDEAEWKMAREKGIRVYTWDGNDPLTDLFLIQLGRYPSRDEIGVDYREILASATNLHEVLINKEAPISGDVLDPSVATQNRPYVATSKPAM
jgi:hypothetical protein